MSKLVKNIVQQFDSKAVRLVKRIVLAVFIILIVLDIVFVAIDGLPTISMVVHDSSPKWMVLIWFFGLFVTNVLFQRKVPTRKNTVMNFFVLAAVSVFLLVLGLMIPQPKQITCDNFNTEIEKVEIPYLTKVKCHDYTDGMASYKNYDCRTLQCNGNICFKLDITVGVKFLLLVLGMVLGYWLWPSVESGKQ